LILNLRDFFQYVVVTVCLKAGLETSAWTWVSRSLKNNGQEKSDKKKINMCVSDCMVFKIRVGR
jgi:hypothetical protein